MIIKYDENGIVEWAQGIGGSDNDYINSVAGTSDGGYIVGGEFLSSSITVGNDVNDNPVKLTGDSDGMIIKYDENGIVEWAQSIGENMSDQINSVAGTSDGGYIVGGEFSSRSITVGNYTLSNAGRYDGMIIKYDANGVVEWAQSIGENMSDQINSVAGTSDGGYIVGGYFGSRSITVGEYTLSNAGSDDGMIIKFEKIELNNPVTLQAQSIGGSSRDYVNSVSGTSDGGYIVGGYFYNDDITVGNDENGKTCKSNKCRL